MGMIAFDTPDGQVGVMHEDGAGAMGLAPGRAPVFSPNGQEIAFASDVGSSTQFSIIGVNGTNLRQFATVGSVGNYKLNRWSPSGNYLAWNSFGQMGGAGDMGLLRVSDGTWMPPNAQYTVGRIYDWSGDGNLAVWHNANMELMWSNPESRGNATQLTKGEYKLDGYYRNARVSPGGNLIAVVGSQVIFKSVPGTSSPFADRVINNIPNPVSVAWSPDGNRLVIGYHPAGSYTATVAIYYLNTNEVQNLPVNSQGNVDWTRQ